MRQAFVVMLPLLWACAPSEHIPINSERMWKFAENPFQYSECGDPGRKYASPDAARLALTRDFGPRLRMAANTEPFFGYESYVATIDGVRLVIATYDRRSAPGRQYQVSEIIIGPDHPPLRFGVRVGMPRTEVDRLFGGSFPDKDVYRYPTVPMHLIIGFERDAVSRIHLEPHMKRTRNWAPY